MSWHLEKSADYDQNGTWLVFVTDQLAGTVTRVRQGWARRHGYQAHVGGIPVGKPCRTRRNAVDRVLASHQPTGTRKKDRNMC